ncbi:uncharacterized protein LOC108679095, partial [Hyalella azteca]|uniref:Uncharacterized protein LOC108679095 n=1 Tax=Hyalella azteca TaxID=294128 RepID=A0A8B7PAU6_HYAAZ
MIQEFHSLTMVKMNGIIGTFLCLVWLVEGSSVLRTSKDATHLSSDVTVGSTKATAEDANLTVTTRYETALEVQWEVRSGESIQICRLDIIHGSTLDTRDCLQPNSKIIDNPQEVVLVHYEKHDRNNVFAGALDNKAFASMNLQTRLEDNDLWYEGGVEKTENFVDQLENEKESLATHYDITGLDACTSYDLELTIIPLGFDPNGYYYEGSLKSEYTLPD